MGLLCSRLRPQQWLKMAVTVHISWTAEPVVTKLDLLMHHCEHQSTVMQKDWFAIFKPVKVRVTMRVYVIRLWLNYGSSFWTPDPFGTKFKFDGNYVVMGWSLLRKDIAVSKQGVHFFLASSGCLVFACLLVLGSLQFWELSDRFFIFSLCCCCWWLLVSCSPWHCALSREGLKVQRCVCNENEVSLLDLVVFFFVCVGFLVCFFNHVVSKWSWADIVLLVVFFLQSSCAGGHCPHGGRNEVWRCCRTH